MTKYRCTFCGMNQELPGDAASYFKEGKPVWPHRSIARPGICMGRLEPVGDAQEKSLTEQEAGMLREKIKRCELRRLLTEMLGGFAGAEAKESMAERYPKYYKDVSRVDSIDVYHVHRLFGVTDNELHHASKKILLCGVRTGGKERRKEIQEARDTLTRWLELESDATGKQ